MHTGGYGAFLDCEKQSNKSRQQKPLFDIENCIYALFGDILYILYAVLIFDVISCTTPVSTIPLWRRPEISANSTPYCLLSPDKIPGQRTITSGNSATYM